MFVQASFHPQLSNLNTLQLIISNLFDIVSPFFESQIKFKNSLAN